MTQVSAFGAPLLRFLVFEGLDGAGTTTQTGLLARRMADSGYSVTHGSEPTAGPVGQLIRRALHREILLTPLTLAYLYAADRQEHIHDPQVGILAAHAGGWIVSDRYLYSSLAYQSLHCPYDTVAALNAAFPRPAVVFYLDTTARVAAERRSSRSAEELFDSLELQESIIANYERAFSQAEHQGVRVVRIDGNRDIEATADTVWKEFSKLPIVEE